MITKPTGRSWLDAGVDSTEVFGILEANSL
jgi:hypothetical protein